VLAERSVPARRRKRTILEGRNEPSEARSEAWGLLLLVAAIVARRKATGAFPYRTRTPRRRPHTGPRPPGPGTS
jgi:hypothetical protein